MNIAIIGYGRMGKTIEKFAVERGHSVGLIVDKDNRDDLNAENLNGIDAAVEFTLPDQAFDNIATCLRSGVPVVSGTTGWLDRFDDAISICEETGSAFMYASNYSIGVNLFFHMNRQLAKLMRCYREYDVGISEIHHTKKLDSPSGTAITLAGEIIASHDGYARWREAGKEKDSEIPIESTREGEVPGTHIVEWNSEIDRIELKHEAKGRDGFALGAIIAAEYIKDKTGFRTLSDMLGF